MELAIRKIRGYFQYYSNWIGFITSIIWVILAIMRFGTYYHWREDYYCNEDKVSCDVSLYPCPADPDWDNDKHDHPCYRNAALTEIYDILGDTGCIIMVQNGSLITAE